MQIDDLVPTQRILTWMERHIEVAKKAGKPVPNEFTDFVSNWKEFISHREEKVIAEIVSILETKVSIEF